MATIHKREDRVDDASTRFYSGDTVKLRTAWPPLISLRNNKAYQLDITPRL